jgi:hypothetical protein
MRTVLFILRAILAAPTLFVIGWALSCVNRVQHPARSAWRYMATQVALGWNERNKERP